MKYKVGDVVKIREDLQVDEIYGKCYVMEGMLKYRGTLHTINYIDDDGDYSLKSINNPEDRTYYSWHKDMLEPVTIKDNLELNNKGTINVIYDKNTIKTENNLEQFSHTEEIKEENNMEYKVGDVVRIKTNLQVGERYGKCRVIEPMLKFKGIVDTIKYIDMNGDFELADDDNNFAWNKDMVELIKQAKHISDLKSVKMPRLDIYEYILNHLEETYEAKNNDYGNSVADTYDKFGSVSFLVRITDKYNRLMTLCDPNAPEQKVKDEKIDDTILDLANYCLLWLVEREYKNQ